MIVEHTKGKVRFVIIGGKTEVDDAAFLEKNLPSGKVLNLAGKTTLRETEAVITLADYYIGHDTGVLHMAAAAKVPAPIFLKRLYRLIKITSAKSNAGKNQS